MEKNIEEHQPAFSAPLRSEQRIQQLLPRALSSLDLIAILVLVVLFVPNISIIQVIQITGPFIYLYWILGFVFFLAPCLLVVAQLHLFIPTGVSIYTWTHHALGSLWGFFAGFCAWLSGILWMLAASSSALFVVRTLSILLFHLKTPWFSQPWQQGLFIIVTMLISGFCSNLPLSTVMLWAKWVAGLYLLGLFVVGLAGLIWLREGHSFQLVAGQNPTVLQGIAIFGFVNNALLGLETPFHMNTEIKNPGKVGSALIWATLLICFFYLVGTFGVTTILSLDLSPDHYTVLAAVYQVFGAPLTAVVSLFFTLFFLLATIIYNIAFSRLLLASALDHRLPAALTRVNRYRTPSTATNFQIGSVILLVIIIYLIAPLFYSKSDFSIRAYDLLLSTGAIFWFFSTLFLFIDLPILLRRYQTTIQQKIWKQFAPSWLLYTCCFVGIIVTLISICVTFAIPIDTLFTPTTWQISIAIAILTIFLVGFLSAAYPRLLNSVQEQTTVARENARLYAELREAYEKLYQLDQHKDAFLSTASHELRTPLTIVQGYVELLNEVDEQLDPETRRTFIRRMRQACDELMLLLANIMDASHLQRDTITLNNTNFYLHTAATFVIELFDPVITQQQRSVHADIPDYLLLHADEIRLKQILRNLLANALRYTPPSTPIFISAHLDTAQDVVEVSISDQGPGIPLDKQEVIFDKFVRLERDMHGDTRGSGLGLAICRQLIEAMHGTLYVKSSGIPGEGATFVFTLPHGHP